ncbi:MAG: hypothetical protein ACJAVK_003265, partial [Akkermansiaceae bacterium]
NEKCRGGGFQPFSGFGELLSLLKHNQHGKNYGRQRALLEGTLKMCGGFTFDLVRDLVWLRHSPKRLVRSELSERWVGPVWLLDGPAGIDHQLCSYFDRLCFLDGSD